MLKTNHTLAPRIFAAAIFAVPLSDCSLHPVPNDVTGITTAEIVQKIRCEARDAVLSRASQWIDSTHNEAAKAQFDAFLHGELDIKDFRSSLFTGEIRKTIEKFENSAIAYDFSFDMTVVNNLDANVDLLKIFPNASFTANIAGGVDLSRQNIRSFSITDTFIGLAKNIPSRYCLAYSEGDPNYLYPISGKVGVAEMVESFLDLNYVNLDGPREKKGPPTMGDVITFTTKVYGSVSPKVVLVPLGHSLRTADASLNLSGGRTDAHKLVIGLSLPPTAEPENETPKAGEKSGLFVTARGTPAELIAAHTVEQIILRFEMGRNSTVVIAP